MNTQPEPQRWATCTWCRRTVPLDEAIDEGWTPEWWHGDISHSTPACTGCTVKHLEVDADGKMVLRPGLALPEGE